jgi:hypothetical protein
MLSEREIIKVIMEEETYSFAIVKTIGESKHLLTEGDEVFETEDKKEATRLVSVLNQNTDSGCSYELISIPKRT